ncbi:hypothetical protein [Egbenema bharatensis]
MSTIGDFYVLRATSTETLRPVLRSAGILPARSPIARSPCAFQGMQSE